MQLQRWFWGPVGAAALFLALSIFASVKTPAVQDISFTVDSDQCVSCPGCSPCLPSNMSSYLQLRSVGSRSCLVANASLDYGSIEFYYAIDGLVDLFVNGEQLLPNAGLLQRVEMHAAGLNISASVGSGQGWMVLGNATLNTAVAYAWVPSGISLVLLVVLLISLGVPEKEWPPPRIMLLTALLLLATGELLILVLAGCSSYQRVLGLSLGLAWALMVDTGHAMGPTIWTLICGALGLCAALGSEYFDSPLIAAMGMGAGSAGLTSLSTVLWRVVKRKLAIYALAQMLLMVLLLWWQFPLRVMQLYAGSLAAQLAINAPLQSVPLLFRVGNTLLAFLLMLLVDCWPLTLGWAVTAVLPLVRREDRVLIDYVN